MREFAQLPIGDLHEPEHAARTAMDETALDDLVTSIRANGIINPLTVCPREAGGHEVIAGHRRLLAARVAGLVTVPAYVEDDPEQISALRLHENIAREDLSPYDEAIFLAELFDKCGEDVDQVAVTVKKTRDYVERRLLLLSGQAEVLQALREGKIILGVAEELNRMELEKDRVWYLDHAVRSGASIRLVRQWRSTANANAAAEREADKREAEQKASGTAPAPAAPVPPADPYAAHAQPGEISAGQGERSCMFCGTHGPEWKMYKKFSCGACSKAWMEHEKERGVR